MLYRDQISELEQYTSKKNQCFLDQPSFVTQWLYLSLDSRHFSRTGSNFFLFMFRYSGSIEVVQILYCMCVGDLIINTSSMDKVTLGYTLPPMVLTVCPKTLDPQQ